MSTAIRSTIRPPASIRITTESATEPYWQAAREHRLVAPRCEACGTFRFPPTPFCPACRSQAIDWVELDRPAIFSFSIVRGLPDQPDDVLVPVVVEFENAPNVHVVSNVIDADPDAVAIGQALRVDFVTIADGWELPVFRLAD